MQSAVILSVLQVKGTYRKKTTSSKTEGGEYADTELRQKRKSSYAQLD